MIVSLNRFFLIALSVSLAGYLAFVPTGPYPIYVASFLKLDVLFATLLLCFCFWFTNKLLKYPFELMAVWGIYLTVTLISVVLSNDIDKSFIGWSIMFGYSLVAFIPPIALRGKGSKVRNYLFSVAVVAALLILILKLFFEYGDIGRFTLGEQPLPKREARLSGYKTVDPNMMAAGLYLSLIGYLPNFLNIRKNILIRIVEVGGIFVIILAALVTMSRSAFLGFFGAILFVSCIMIFRNILLLRRIDSVVVKLIALTVVIILLLLSSYQIFPGAWDSLFRKLARSASDHTRLRIMGEAYAVYTSGIKEFIIGTGYLTSNPHNEILRAASSTGSVGLISMALFCVTLFFVVIKTLFNKPVLLFSALAIFAYVFIITLFYGYSKLLWVAVMLLLFLYWEGRRFTVPVCCNLDVKLSH